MSSILNKGDKEEGRRGNGITFLPGTGTAKTVTKNRSIKIKAPPDEKDNNNGSRSTGINFLPDISLKAGTQTTTTKKIRSITMAPPANITPAIATATIAASSATKKKRRKPIADGKAPGPKFGLVQWQRLLSSSKDLAQRKGAPYRRDIPWEEIKQHDKPHDCWMVLRGTVYNIGPYLSYHPGGIKIFSRNNLMGGDGSKFFDKYHSWVSIEGLVGVLAIGTAARIPEELVDASTSLDNTGK
mmetsp:Transcript_29851/g.63913  ORF Transcript_29851/g.63913 Transcript_29851/m.63913 type:complete len:242 (-) Transcript_29851:24-749(-)